MYKKIYFQTIFLLCILFTQNITAQTFNWAKQIRALNASTDVVANKTLVDNLSNIYVLGFLAGSADFDPSASNSILTTPSNAQAMFVQKLDSNGAFIWAKLVTGIASSFLQPFTIAFNNSQSNIIISGIFDSQTDFNPGSAVNNITPVGDQDGFVLNLDNNGNFVWVKIFEASANSSVDNLILSVDKSDNIITSCNIQGVMDADPGAGVMSVGALNTINTPIVKLNSAGGLLFAKTLTSSFFVSPGAIAIDNNKNIIIGGLFFSDVDLNPSTIVANTFISNGITDAFITKLDSTGNYIWGKSFGGIDQDQISTMEIDMSNNIYLGGIFIGTCDFDPNSGVVNLSSGQSINSNVFLSKLNSSGNLLWAKSFVGDSNSNILDIAIDATGNVYSTGFFAGLVDFNPSTTASQSYTAAGDANIFISKLNTNGNYVYAHNLGNSKFDAGAGITIDSSNHVIVSGVFQGTVDFDPASTINNLISNNSFVYDGLILKWNQCPIVNTTINATGCSYTLNGQVYTGNGTYLQSYPITGGCDSTVTLNLSGSATNTIINPLSCSGNYTYNGITYTTAGTYNLQYQNAAGCDSNTTINLSIGVANTGTENISACDFYFYNGTFYNNSFTYTKTLVNSTGCDSIVSVNVTIFQPTFTNVNLNSCKPITYNGQVYTSSGQYSNQYMSINGCDSFVNLSINITPIPTTNATKLSCGPYTFNGQTYPNSGTYTIFLQNALGCDSNTSLNLTVVKPVVTVSQSGPQLTSNAPAPAMYQWVKCNPFTILPNQTNQMFMANANGDYAVIVTINACSDTSDCLTVSNVGIENPIASVAKLYPNPVSNELHIELEKATDITYQITNSTGQLLIKGKSNNAKNLKIPVLQLSNGIYFVSIHNGITNATYKFIKE